MKFWNKNAALAFLLATGIVLSGCGSGSSKSYDQVVSPASPPSISYSSSAAMTETGENASDEGNSLQEVSLDSRKIIKNAQIMLESKEFDHALEQISAHIQEAGGYLERQSSSGKSLYDKSEYMQREAHIQARIPSNRLDQVVAQIKAEGNLTNYEEYVDDITEQYYDVQAHLDMLKLQEQRLLELLDKATKLSDILDLEEALTQCRYEIESLTGKVRRMDSQVSLSTLTIELLEVAQYKEITTQPQTFGERVAESLKTSGRNITNLLENILFFAIERLPILLILALFIGSIAALITWITRKISAKRPKPQYPTNYTPGNYQATNYTQKPKEEPQKEEQPPTDSQQ